MKKIYYTKISFGSSELIKLFEIVDGELVSVATDDRNVALSIKEQAKEMYEAETGLGTEVFNFVFLNLL